MKSIVHAAALAGLIAAATPAVAQARGRVSPEAMTAAVDPLAAENPARLVRFILGMVECDRGKAKQPAGRAG